MESKIWPKWSIYKTETDHGHGGQACVCQGTRQGWWGVWGWSMQTVTFRMDGWWGPAVQQRELYLVSWVRNWRKKKKGVYCCLGNFVVQWKLKEHCKSTIILKKSVLKVRIVWDNPLFPTVLRTPHSESLPPGYLLLWPHCSQEMGQGWVEGRDWWNIFN